MVDLNEAQRHLLNQESGPHRLTLLKAIDELYAARAELTALRAKAEAGRKLAEAVRQAPNAGYWRAIPSELAEFDAVVKP